MGHVLGIEIVAFEGDVGIGGGEQSKATTKFQSTLTVRPAMSLGVENDADRVLPDCCNTAARRRVCCCCRAQHSAKRAAGPRAGALQGISAGSLHAAESVRRAAF